jgi:hypothetical protein
MTLLVEKPYAKEFQQTYSALAAAHPEYDLNDPDMMSNYEKQLVAQYTSDQGPGRANELKLVIPGTQTRTTKIPLDAHLHTWGGAIPYLDNDIFPEDDTNATVPSRIKRRPRTGIHGEVNAKARDQSSVIRPLKFRTLAESEAGDRSLSRDCATSALVFAPGGKRSDQAITELPGGTEDTTVDSCLRRFFDPELGIPFVPADVGRYFPIELLVPAPAAQAAAESELSEELNLAVAAPEENEMKTALLDTSEEDVLFTKDKAPFTRHDISTVRAFTRHWDALKLRQKERIAQAMQERQKSIKQAFHSKNVFETALDLVDQDCKRMRSGLIGKSQFKRKSIWKTAEERAPPDHGGLTERRALWWRFCAFVRYVGGIDESLEKHFARMVRVKLMLRHQVDPTLFWDVVKEMPQAAFESVSVLRLMEFLRLALDVGQQEFVMFMEEQKVAQLMYGQTVKNNMSREYLDKQQAIAKGPIDVPECD